MKRFVELIPRYLIKNKKRTGYIAFTIVTAIILLIAVRVITNMLSYNVGNNAVVNGGGIYHVSYMQGKRGLEEESEEAFEYRGKYQLVGSQVFEEEKSSIQLVGLEKNTYELLNLSVMEGKDPISSGEIALEKWAKDKFFKDKKIGDKVSIEYEEKIYDRKTGELVKITENTYEGKLVGILNDNKNHHKDRTALATITLDESESIKKETFYPTVYGRIKDEKNVDESIDKLSKDNKGIRFDRNYAYISGMKLKNAVDNLGIFIMLIVMISAIGVIYNIFYITVIERIREFSMLRGIGASKRDIVFLVVGEAIVLATISIPIGILIGYFAIEGIFSFLKVQNNLSVSNMITGIDVTIISLLGAIVVVLSSLSPCIFGSKINPIEGMKDNFTNDLTKQGKYKVRKKRLGNILSFSSYMAYNNIKKSKKRCIAIVISFTISIVLIVSSAYLMSIMDDEKGAFRSTGGDVLLKVDSTTGLIKNFAFNEEDIKEIEKTPGIKEINKHLTAYAPMYFQEEELTESGKINLSKSKKGNKQNLYQGNIGMYGVDKEEFEKLKPYLESGSLEWKEFNGKNKFIVVQGLHYKNYTNLKVGDEIIISYAYQEKIDGKWFHTEDMEMRVGATLSSTPIRPIDGMASVVVICSNDTIRKYLGVEDYTMININLDKGTEVDNVKNQLMPIVEKKNDASITTLKEVIESNKKSSMVITYITTFFAISLGVIAVFNIINTLSIEIMLRKKELGTFRAVGMSKREIIAMILKEGAIYGILSSILGSILGLVCSHKIYMILRSDLLENEPYIIPWKLVIITFVGIIGTSVITAIPSSIKSVKESIVDSIKAIE